MRKKGAIDFSFTWIFAIIAGAFILFIAIFAVYKFTHSGNSLSDTE